MAGTHNVKSSLFKTAKTRVAAKKISSNQCTPGHEVKNDTAKSENYKLNSRP